MQVREAPIFAANVSKVWPGDVSMPLRGAGVQQGQGRACSTHAGHIPSLQQWHCVALTRIHRLRWLPALHNMHQTCSAALTSSKPSRAAMLLYKQDSATTLLPFPCLAACTYLQGSPSNSPADCKQCGFTCAWRGNAYAGWVSILHGQHDIWDLHLAHVQLTGMNAPAGLRLSQDPGTC